MASKFITCDRNTLYLLPPSIQDWLPEKHLARFVVEIIEQCDVSALEKKYGVLGRQAYPVHMMLSLIFYGYITGVHSSRKIEQATYESVPFRYIAANLHPDHDSIAHFRKQFLTELKDIFLQVLKIASTMDILKMGKVSTDGSKIKANASKHKALSWEYANKLEEQLKAEVEQLMNLASDADEAIIPKDMSIPDELSLRNKRLKAIAEAKKKIEERAEERYQREKAEYDEKLDQRKKAEEASGKKNNRKPPKPPTQGPKKNDQINLTDEESRIMPKSGGGFEQGYNAQASVDIESMLIVANYVTQQPNDKQQIAPTIEQIQKTEVVIGKCNGMLADAGYFSKDNVERCETAKIAPLIVDKRDKHNKSLMARFEEPGELPENADAVTKMKYELKTKDGKELYAKRKTTVEPVFGIIKNVMKFRSFSLKGIKAVDGEWNIVSIAWNIKRMFAFAV
jgi:transposase